MICENCKKEFDIAYGKSEWCKQCIDELIDDFERGLVVSGWSD